MVLALKNSCNGWQACNSLASSGDTNGVGPITESCNGSHACINLSYRGAVGPITESCNGYSACRNLGYRGSLGPITKSCNGVNACLSVATSAGGAVTSITSSCNGEHACLHMAYSAASSIGSINKSCNRDDACYLLVKEGGSIKSIEKTCNNDKHKPCKILRDEQDVGHLTKFVHADAGEKFTENSIGSIEDCNAQCVSDSECKGIKWKAHSFHPCRFFGGEISENKCNGRNVCITV